MAVWPYPPQSVLTETLTAFVRQSASAPRTEVTDAITENLIRAFRLRYTTVDSSDATGMAAFFAARRGGFETFTFFNPNDGRPYAVRCATDQTLTLFTPGLWQSGVDLVFVVVSG